MSACSRRDDDAILWIRQCGELKTIIQNEFILYNSTWYKENCWDYCDWIPAESKLIDVFYSNKNKDCYLAQEIIWVEWVSYYEIYSVGKLTDESYETIWEPVFSKTCIDEYLFLNAIDQDITTGDKLEENRREVICDYKAESLDKQLKTRIKEMK
jgi:hypothetical protein